MLKNIHVFVLNLFTFYISSKRTENLGFKYDSFVVVCLRKKKHTLHIQIPGLNLSHLNLKIFSGMTTAYGSDSTKLLFCVYGP